jgi:hypothetical protein
MIYQKGNMGFGSMRNTSNTVLLIHSDTTDGSTTFTDSSASGHTITANGDAQHDTAQKKWGASSMLFDGTTDDISAPDHADWNMGTGAVTIDFWVRFAALPAASTHMGFCGQAPNAIDFYAFYIKNVSGTYSLSFTYEYDNSNVIDFSKTWTTPAINTWYHLALIRGWGGSTSSWGICVDGKLLQTAASDGSTWNDIGDTFTVGSGQTALSFNAQKYLNGWIDEFRVVKGEAMWTSEFIPPAGPYS